MSERKLFQAADLGSRVDQTDKPAIGIITSDDRADETARTVLRARRNGHSVLVTHRANEGGEAVSFASQLGAQIVTPSTDRNDESLVQTLTNASQQLGFPGLIVHSDLEEYIDYDRSVLEHTREDAYAVRARTERTGGLDDVLVAIPAYNEADSIGDVVAQARSHVDTVLVIDDGSADETAERARDAGATVFEHRTNRGYGGALRTAFRQADRRGADHLIVLDGDGQHDPDDIPKLLAEQRETGAEIVIGSRFDPDSETDLPVYRRFGLWVVNTIVNIGLNTGRSGSRISDTQSGFRAYDARAIRSLANEDRIGDRMDASIDVIYHAYRNGYRIDEIGTTIDYDVENASSHDPISHGLVLARNAITTAGFERPLPVLGAPGFLVSLFGLVTVSFLFMEYTPAVLSSPLVVFLSVVAFLTGLVICVWAVVVEAVSMATDRDT
ncbi:glycosyltransferase family 2 protein [Natrinema versiforme]|uniref:Family 2 glycosyl transferase n=1 Tax=Natrinema versiforme JCM 10478 TaxID=1227496 RepID=L9XZR6_9EURY|nr:glycosyltransferase family 2 protein [Natrinema versiforme]ELY67285.1 family 2 glycosyl transferase [Natrinema versiforme JCM 10478]